MHADNKPLVFDGRRLQRCFKRHFWTKIVASKPLLDKFCGKQQTDGMPILSGNVAEDQRPNK